MPASRDLGIVAIFFSMDAWFSLERNGMKIELAGFTHRHSKLCVTKNASSVSRSFAMASRRASQVEDVLDVCGPYERGSGFCTFLLQPVGFFRGSITHTRISNEIKGTDSCTTAVGCGTAGVTDLSTRGMVSTGGMCNWSPPHVAVFADCVPEREVAACRPWARGVMC